LSRQTFGVDEIPGIRLRYRDIVAHRATHGAINQEMSFQPTLAPHLSHVRGFQDYRNATESTDRRGYETGSKQVRVKDIYLVLTQDFRKAKTRGNLMEVLEIQRHEMNIFRQV
jgi:hypothetical protein